MPYTCHVCLICAFMLFNACICAKESISAEWASSFGAWYVHTIAMASLRCYPMLCVERGVHAYDIAEKLLKYFEKEGRRCGQNQCKSRLASA